MVKETWLAPLSFAEQSKLDTQILTQKLNHFSQFKQQWNFSYAATACSADRERWNIRRMENNFSVYFRAYNRIRVEETTICKKFTVFPLVLLFYA
jgi:hypothetical protein